MRAQNINALLLGICGVASASEPAAFPFASLNVRLRAETHGYVAAIVSTEHCSSAATLPEVVDERFQSSYPHGLFVICDAQVSSNRAGATVLRYIFNASKGQVLVASSIEAKLSSRSGAWHVDAWSKSFVDYAPNYSLKRTG